MNRIFLAFPLPDKIKDLAAEIIKKLRAQTGDKEVKWINAANAHITVSFLGKQSDKDVAKIIDAIKPIASQATAFELETNVIDCFPNQRNPRVIFVNLKEKGEPQLAEFVKKVERAAEPFEHKIYTSEQKKKWHAHVTLGRVKGKWACPKEPPKFAPQSFLVDKIILFKSTLTPRGSEYEVIEKFPFKNV